MDHKEYLRKIGRKGGKSRWENISDDLRSEHGQMMARARKLKVESLSKENNIEIKHG